LKKANVEARVPAASSFPEIGHLDELIASRRAMIREHEATINEAQRKPVAVLVGPF
jgi:hypothetical protein